MNNKNNIDEMCYKRKVKQIIIKLNRLIYEANPDHVQIITDN
jgi:predicted secreted protein